MPPLAARHGLELPGSVTSFGWRDALVFSALIAATDPIAVVALFKSLGAPKRLGVLTEGESLVNDGTAIVLFSIIYRRRRAPPHQLGRERAGTRASGRARLRRRRRPRDRDVQVVKRVDDSMIGITLTMVTAYGSFALGGPPPGLGRDVDRDRGMVCGRYAAPHGMCTATRGALESFWEYVAFALTRSCSCS